MIEVIKKRNGQTAEFDRGRIERAMEKAFVATNTGHDNDLLVFIVDNIIRKLEQKFADRVPGVEDIQDIVEEKLVEKGFLDVARAYIVYRRERAKIREKRQKEILKRIEKSDLQVEKRDGSLAIFDINEIKRAIVDSFKEGIDGVEVEAIIEGAKHNIYDGITTPKINEAVLLAIRNKFEEDPIYSTLAARFLLNDLYKEILGVNEADQTFIKRYRAYFPKKIQQGVKAGKLDKRLLNFNLQRLAATLKPENDHLLAYMGTQVLYDRYFVRDNRQIILETPQYFWMRVAMGIALTEKEKQREKRAIEFYKVMSAFLYVPSTPTLLHAGTVLPQMSSCYLTTVEDDLHHIFKCISDNAQLSKYSGGVANDWNNVRATGSLIKSINVGSQGVVPFLKIVDSTTSSINRSGKRRGATCVYLETWHYDIEDFLDLRKNTGDERRRTHDTNTANWIPDLFIERLLADQLWTLFSPEEVPELHHLYGQRFREKYEEYEKKAAEGKIKLFKRVQAQELWRKIITMLFETGHPWLTFKDPANIRSPQDHAGVVHCSNLCTEITLNTSAEETAVCNLGSLCLNRHISGGVLNWELLKETTLTAVRMLDNIIDINFYPTKEAETANLRHRPVGLGMMGLQDTFFQLGLQFDSQAAVDFSDQVMEFISYQTILGSAYLAKERGVYASYQGSKWQRGLFPIDTIALLEKERCRPVEVDRVERLNWAEVREAVRKYGLRNSNCLAIAPTATISNISGCLPSIEPIYKNLYVKSNFSGEFVVVNEYLVNDLKQLNLWTKDLREKIKYYDGSIQKIMEIPAEIRARYKEVFEIDPHWLVLHAARRSKWIDQSQSLNIFTSSRSGRFITDVYLTAWRMGLKTTYYLRTLAASAIEKSTLDINKNYESQLADQQQLEKIREAVDDQAVLTIQPSLEPAVVASPPGKINALEEGICDSCQ